MRRFLILSTALLISTAGPLGAKSGVWPPKDGASAALEKLRHLREAKGLDDLLTKGGPTCNELDPDEIACNSVTNSTLIATDCLLDDGTVFDFYIFDGSQGDQVEINLTSSDFDTVVFLLDPQGGLFVFDDDGGNGTNSRIVTTLDQDGNWGIAVNNFAELPGDPGAYTLTLDCLSQNCVSSSTALCLNQDRFRVEVEWTDFQGVSGPARVVSLPVASDDSGILYFFDPDNWEMLIKVLNGCAINNHYWVFGAATTNVQYSVQVTDTEADQVSTYFNPLGVSSPAITDTSAFATCP